MKDFWKKMMNKLLSKIFIQKCRFDVEENADRRRQRKKEFLGIDA